YKNTATREYLMENKADAAKSIIVEHPLWQGWKLVDSDQPIETTETLYRFKGKIDAGKASKLVVKEEIVQGQSVAILPADNTMLVEFSRRGEIPADTRKALATAIEMKQKLLDTDRQIAEKRKTVADIRKEQQPIR